ncbi:unnamed protein product [Prunus armeniaca]|uniref:Uncharacterized protein n=1 Tax=Prunus armeniaca TaxID=36596 RepID=A0A6J5WJG3_PRUAR|nr:unnamed protein product [Prunus armeniaca]
MKSQHLQTDSKQNPWLGWLVWVTTVAWVARLVGCGRWLGKSGEGAGRREEEINFFFIFNI